MAFWTIFVMVKNQINKTFGELRETCRKYLKLMLMLPSQVEMVILLMMLLFRVREGSMK